MTIWLLQAVTLYEETGQKPVFLSSEDWIDLYFRANKSLEVLDRETKTIVALVAEQFPLQDIAKIVGISSRSVQRRILIAQAQLNLTLQVARPIHAKLSAARLKQHASMRKNNLK